MEDTQQGRFTKVASCFNSHFECSVDIRMFVLEYREFTQEVLGVVHRTHNHGFIMITWVGASDMEPESGHSLKI